MSQIFLNQFHIEKPAHCVSQEVLLNWIIKCHQLAEASKDSTEKLDPEIIKKLFQRYSVKPAQISQRYLESNDIFSENFEEHEVYRLDANHNNGFDILERAHFFSKKAMDVFNKFYPRDSSVTRPNHLIHVTCTGYISPSAAQKIVAEKTWNQTTDITHAYHMGCYASMPAVRLAKSIVLSEIDENNLFKVDIVHNEMCGLHMNALAQTPEQMVVQTLFADGHVKYSATGQKNHTSLNLRVISILEKIVSESVGDMSWIPAPWGMQMNLSREVPAKIKPELKSFLIELCKKAKLNPIEIKQAIYAVHPGGPKIIDSVQEVLELSEEQIKESRKILFERGNMSSATLPHIWNEILENKYPIGTKVISFAFGPGLTIFGALFEVC